MKEMNGPWLVRTIKRQGNEEGNDKRRNDAIISMN
jgi:hypothetical protein